MKYQSLLFLLVVGVLIMPHLPLSRVDAVANSGITVSPVQVTLNTADESGNQKAIITIRNDYAERISFEASIHGMQLLANGSLTPTVDPDPVLSAALMVTPQLFSLDAGQSTSIELRIIDTVALPPGGHYASLLIRQKDTANRQLALTPAISVVVFMIKEDGAVRSIAATSIKTNGSLFKLPTKVVTEFVNTGNVSVVPRATITVADPRGNRVQAGIANEDSAQVKPGRPLKIESVLGSTARIWLPGKYEVQVQYRYDGSDEQYAVTIKQWFIPPLFVVGLIIVAGLVFMGRKYAWRILKLVLSLKQRRTRRTTVSTKQKHSSKSIDGIVTKKHDTPPKRLEK